MGEAPFLADPAMPVLGKGLCHLNAQSMEHEIVAVLIFREKFSCCVADPRAHGDDVEGGEVKLAGVLWTEEVRDAEPRSFALAGEVETRFFGLTTFISPDHEVVSIPVGREVAPDDHGQEHV